MKKLFAIIPAAVLGIGAAAAGVLACASSADKESVGVDYAAAFSKDNDRTDEMIDSSAVSFKGGAQNNFIDENNDGICDNHVDGACPQNGMGNGCGRGNSGGNRHHGNGCRHGRNG